MSIRHSASLLVLIFAGLLASCCEPSHKNSTPVSVDALFAESYAYDLDAYNTRLTGVTDSGYYPIYTFGIRNVGTDDDDFRMNIVLTNGAEIDIIKHVKAGDTALFRTPTLPLDPSAQYIFPNFTSPADTSMPLARDYYGFFTQTPETTEIHSVRPTITISFGEIYGGPEACNTPASVQTLNIDALPHR